MKPKAENIADPLLKPSEGKTILNVSLATVYNLVERGQLPAVIWESPDGKGKRTIRIKRSDIFDIIERHYQGQG